MPSSKESDEYEHWAKEYEELVSKLGALRSGKYPDTFRPKQLPPDHPRHHEPDGNGFTCGCAQPDDHYMIWMLMSGRGFGKSLVGSTWITRQALRYPGSEWAVFAPTFRDTRKVCIEGTTGILAALDSKDELAQYRRNELQVVLKNGSVIYGYSADQPERARGANLHGAWCDELGCLPGGTLVQTASGEVPIEEVRAGDYVHTRTGLRRVSWSGPTRRNAELWELATVDGRRLVCTPDHRVWTNAGWVEARDVTPSCTMVAWESSPSGQPLGLNGTVAAGTTTRKTTTTAIDLGSSCTEPSGRTTTAPSPPVASSTMLTTTSSTTTSATCACSAAWPSTPANTPKSGSTPTGSPTVAATPPSGAPIGCGASGSPMKSPAPNAASCSCLPECGASSVPQPARRATYVAVVSSKPLANREPVTYDLTVEGEPEFYANGLLVHNSWRYDTTWHEGLVPALRKGEHPRVVVTTTPRPTALIRDLLTRKDGSVHVTRGSTWENSANLSAAALAELRHRYEGSRLGRQELEGELLEDLEGALWNHDMINSTRILEEDLPPLTRIVVGVDPAVTSGEDADETGIIVVGQYKDHAYVLADYSLRGTPHDAMVKAVNAYWHHQADCIVAEVNNGGDYIGAVLKAIDNRVPYRQVRATRGKLVRAEPVAALYEQRRVHHLGVLGELEDQLCSYIPDMPGKSPDRLDACLAEGTMVLTAQGEQPIEQVRPGATVWTRAGWRPVLDARLTRRNAAVMTVELSDGTTLCGTPDHQVLANGAWTRLDALMWGDIMDGWKTHPSPSSIEASFTSATPMASSAPIGSTTKPPETAGATRCIATSGETSTARKSRMAGTSTTWTTTPTTTTLATSCSSPLPNMRKSTLESSTTRESRTWTPSGTLPPPGTAATPDSPGTANTAGAPGKVAPHSAAAAAKHAALSSTTTTAMPATARARASIEPGNANTWKPSSAPCAEATSSGIDTARGPRHVAVHVVRSYANSEPQNVYDLMIADQHEFVASGVIVHNCVWSITELRGLSAGSWLEAYHIVECATCAHKYMADLHQRCPRCGTVEVNENPGGE